MAGIKRPGSLTVAAAEGSIGAAAGKKHSTMAAAPTLVSGRKTILRFGVPGVGSSSGKSSASATVTSAAIIGTTGSASSSSGSGSGSGARHHAPAPTIPLAENVAPASAAAAASRLGLQSKTWNDLGGYGSVGWNDIVRVGAESTWHGGSHGGHRGGFRPQQYQPRQQEHGLGHSRRFNLGAGRGTATFNSGTRGRAWSPSSSSGPEEGEEEDRMSARKHSASADSTRPVSFAPVRWGRAAPRSSRSSAFDASALEDDRPSDLVATWGSGSNSPVTIGTVGDQGVSEDDEVEPGSQQKQHLGIGHRQQRSRQDARHMHEDEDDVDQRDQEELEEEYDDGRGSLDGEEDDEDEEEPLSDDTSHVRQRVTVAPAKYDYKQQSRDEETQREKLLDAQRVKDMFSRGKGRVLDRPGLSKSQKDALLPGVEHDPVTELGRTQVTRTSATSQPLAIPAIAAAAVMDRKQAAISRVQHFLHSTPVPSLNPSVASYAAHTTGVGAAATGAGASLVSPLLTTVPTMAPSAVRACTIESVALSGGVRGRRTLLHVLAKANPKTAPGYERKSLGKVSQQQHLTVTEYVLGGHSRQDSNALVELTHPASVISDLGDIEVPSKCFPLLFEEGSRTCIDARILFSTGAGKMQCFTVRMSDVGMDENMDLASCKVDFVPVREHQGVPLGFQVQARLLRNRGNALKLKMPSGIAERVCFLELKVGLDPLASTATLGSQTTLVDFFASLPTSPPSEAVQPQQHSETKHELKMVEAVPEIKQEPVVASDGVVGTADSTLASAPSIVAATTVPETSTVESASAIAIATAEAAVDVPPASVLASTVPPILKSTSSLSSSIPSSDYETVVTLNSEQSVEPIPVSVSADATVPPVAFISWLAYLSVMSVQFA
jgi:hypothetical protein